MKISCTIKMLGLNFFTLGIRTQQKRPRMLECFSYGFKEMPSILFGTMQYAITEPIIVK